MSLVPTYKSLSALSPIYLNDPNDKVNYISEDNFTYQGLNLLTYNVNKSVNDSFIKNYTSNNIIKDQRSTDIFNLKKSIAIQDLNTKLNFKITQPELSSVFVMQTVTTRDDKDSPITFNIDITDLNGSKFLVDFIDNEFATVSLIDGRVPKFLYDGGGEALIFKFLNTDNLALTSNYYFNYFYDSDNKRLRLYKDNEVVTTTTTTLTTETIQISAQGGSGENVFVTVVLSATINTIGLSALSEENIINGTIGVDNESVLLRTDNIDQFIYYDFENNNILSNDTLSGINYDLLTYYSYSNILTGERNFADFNFINLKNHISNDNIAYSGDNLEENRDDNLLYTGRKYHNFTNQKSKEKDYDNISLNYTFFDKEFKIGKKELTEFTLPDNLFPFKKININDTGLADNGSFAATNPYFSDKVFKLTDTNKNNLQNEFIDDEEFLVNQDDVSLLVLQSGGVLGFESLNEVEGNDIFGDYLCTWLKGDGIERGVWFDRYYIPKSNSFTVSFTGESNIFVNTTQAAEFFNNENETDLVYYDLRSNLTFEPSASYVYQRINDKQIDSYIDSQKDKLIRDTYTIQTSSVQLQNIEEVDLNTVKGFDLIDINNIPNKDFNLGFELELDSLSSLDSYQLFGNLYEDGFSIKNNFYFTPFIIIPQGNILYIYDNNFKLLRTNTYESTENILDVLYIEQNNNIVIICDNKIIKTNYFGEILDERYPDAGIADNDLILEIIKSYKSRTFHGYNNVFFITNKYVSEKNIINLDMNNLFLSENTVLQTQFENLTGTGFESIVPAGSTFKYLVGRTPAKLTEEVSCSLETTSRFISKQFIPGDAFLNTTLENLLSSGIMAGQSFDEDFFVTVQAATAEALAFDSAWNGNFGLFFDFIQDGRARIVFDQKELTKKEDPIVDSINSEIFDINSVGDRLFVQYVNLTGNKGFVQEFTTERYKLSAFELSKPTREGYKIDFVKENNVLKIMSFAKDLSAGHIFVDKINAETGATENSYSLGISGIDTSITTAYATNVAIPVTDFVNDPLTATYPNGLYQYRRIDKNSYNDIITFNNLLSTKFDTLTSNNAHFNPINFYALDQKYRDYGENIVFKFNLNSFLNIKTLTEVWNAAGPPISAYGYDSFTWTNPALNLSAWDGKLISESSEDTPQVEIIFVVPNIEIKNYFNIDFNLNGGEIKLYNNGLYFGTINFNPNLVPIDRIIYPSLFINSQNIRNLPIDNIVRDIKYNSSGGRIKNLKMHNTSFDQSMVNYLELQTKSIDPLYFRLPCGTRNANEEIDTLFTYNIPGNISNNIKVNIKDISITESVKQQLKDYLEKSVEIITPSQQTLTYNID